MYKRIRSCKGVSFWLYWIFPLGIFWNYFLRELMHIWSSSLEIFWRLLSVYIFIFPFNDGLKISVPKSPCRIFKLLISWSSEGGLRFSGDQRSSIPSLFLSSFSVYILGFLEILLCLLSSSLEQLLFSSLRPSSF